MTRIYTPLTDLPQVPIERCSQVLPNKMQCWKAGDVLIVEGTPQKPIAPPARGQEKPVQAHAQAQATQPPPSTPPVAPVVGAPKEPKEPKEGEEPPTSYQLCLMHATIQQRADELQTKLGPPKAGEPSVHDKMMALQQTIQTTVPPHAREEKNYVRTPAEKELAVLLGEEEEQKDKSQKDSGKTSAPPPPTPNPTKAA